jgi:hypothetical protein
MVTAKSLRAAAARKRAEADALEAAADALESLNVSEGLPRSGDYATLATTMEAPSAQTKMSRAHLGGVSRKHPFIAALVAKNVTVTKAATELGESRTTVQSWYTKGAHGRPIPRAAAEKIRKLYGVPVSAWPDITD